MTDGTRSLTPTLALAYLRELSLDVRAALVLDPAGEPLAGDEELAGRTRTALAAGEPTVSGDPYVEQSGGEIFVVARAAGGGAIALSVGPHALIPLLLHDLGVVSGELL